MVPENNATETPSTSADSLSANNGSHTTTLNIGQQWAESTLALIAQQDLPAERRRFFTELAAFSNRTGCAAVTDHEIDLWGYGTVRVVFADNDGNWWAPLTALCDPTGIDFDTLRGMYEEAVEEGDDDVEILSWLVEDTPEREHCFLEMVGPGFAMRAMMSGPWGKEFAAALMPTFRRAIVSSGLGDNLGPVIRINEDGRAEQTDMTFTEFLAQGEPLPTPDQARDSAFRGPAGAL
ncbi:MAG: hypothetical protein ABW156_02465 [Jiangellaceae bacterium]